MTVMSDAIDTTTLGWIKPELDETLRQARQEIEAFAEAPALTERMRVCANHLHQVHGTLRMVELNAPAMVAEEMERLALALQRGEIAALEDACAVLMRGVVQLPDYLERLQGGHRDISIVLLPLLNELRAARGVAGLSESVLFAPNLDMPLPVDLPLPTASATSSAIPVLGALTAALAAWPADGGAPPDAARLSTAADGLLAHVEVAPLRRMLWVASSVASALRDGAIAPTPALRETFSAVEREVRQLLEGGPGTARTEADPTRELLYHVATTGQAHPALDGLRQTFQLDSHLRSDQEIDHARGSLSGRNRALLDTVSVAIKEDLLRVKDALDLYLRTGKTDITELRPQVDALGRISDTLGMMGLGVARGVVVQQRDAMQQIVSGERAADESALLEVAGALLYVDGSLDEQVSGLGLSDAPGNDDRLAGESRKVLDIVVREAIANFGDARQSFVAFIETGWDHAELCEIPRLLDEVGGALRILNLPLPAQYLSGIKRYAKVELIDRHRVPSGQQLDTLADALASVEYYLEALRDQRPNRDRILDIARHSLESLHYWPLPAEVAEPSDEALAALAPVVDEILATGRGPAASSEPAMPSASDGAVVPTPAGAATASGVDGFEHSDDIDDEIREVFLEELEEEISNLGQMLALWRAAPNEPELLRPIRRVFHTLKGSGRLVGARTLGEFSWKVENMLNRVLDGTRTATPAVIALVEQVHVTLPQLHAALQGSAPIEADLEGMKAVADRLAAGEEARFVAAPAPEPSVDLPESLGDAAEPVDELAAVAPDAEVASQASVAPAEAVEPEGVPASVDPVLLEILSSEVSGHLATIEDWLATSAAEPQPVNEQLQRAIHTLNGAFAMTEVPVITDVTSPTETYVRRLLASGQDPGPEGLAGIAAVATAIARTMAALQSISPRVPVFEGLAGRMEALRDALPAVRPPTFDESDIGFDGSGALTSVDMISFIGDDAEADADAMGSQLPIDGADAAPVQPATHDAEAFQFEPLDADRNEAESAEAERVEAERADAERLETERAEAAEAERAEAERVEAERADAERLE
ncbi:MAG TPA: Hpt domain-containing protein, partial [Lysobacter sp.]|nr:Hpt domain-containing protein [Lysobacter sp.]